MERDNPRLFADNVQRVIAEHLKVPAVARSVDDMVKTDES